MTLREKLEKIWQKPGCMRPNNLCRWSDYGSSLAALAGTPRGPIPKNKKKGYSHLPRNYGVMFNFHHGKLKP